MPARQYIYLLISLSILLIAGGCNEKYTPKPYGYYRIDFPEKAYCPLADSFPYRFEKAADAQTEIDRDEDAEPYCINLVYPAYNAKYIFPTKRSRRTLPCKAIYRTATALPIPTP